jgi:hypothetical protein
MQALELPTLSAFALLWLSIANHYQNKELPFATIITQVISLWGVIVWTD